jgi:hypothetical protein
MLHHHSFSTTLALQDQLVHSSLPSHAQRPKHCASYCFCLVVATRLHPANLAAAHCFSVAMQQQRQEQRQRQQQAAHQMAVRCWQNLPLRRRSGWQQQRQQQQDQEQQVLLVLAAL